MGRPQTEYINASKILVGAHALFAAPAPASYPEALVALAAKNPKLLTNAEKLQIADLIKSTFDALPWVNCGALDDGKLESENKVNTREHQNVLDQDQVTDNTTKYTAKLFELMNPVVEPTLACGLKSFINVPGDAVTGKSFVIPSGFSYGKAYKIPFQNADGAEPTISSPTGSVDGSLTRNDDFIVQNNGDGSYSIIPFQNASGSSALTTTAQTLTFTLAYTPTAYRLVGEGGLTDIEFLAIKIVNFDTNNLPRSWIIPRCSQTKGFNMDGKKYNDDKPDVGTDVEINGKLDTRLPAGFQGLIRHDEVNVA